MAGEQRRYLRFAVAYVCIWIATWCSARLLETLGVASLWYLPGGLRFCCLFVLGWVGVALEVATAAVLLLLQWLLSDSAATQTALSVRVLDTFYIVLAFPLAYAAVVLPLRWRLRAKLDLTRPAHSMLFIAAALGASALAATAGTLQLLYLGVLASSQWSDVFTSWLTGDFIGIITLAPLLLVVVWPRVRLYLQLGRWALPHRPRQGPGGRRALCATTLLVVGALLLVMGGPHLLGMRQQSPVLVLLLLLPLATVALRYNLGTTVWAIVLLDGGLVLMVALLELRQTAIQYQWEMIAIALFGLWLGGTVEARNRLLARLRDFSSVSNDLLWESDADGVLSVSGRLAEEISLPSGQSWRSLLEPVLQPHLAQLEQARQSRQPFSRLEIALPGGNGTPRWISVNGIPLWDEVGAYAGYRGTATDISDAVKGQQLMERYNQQLLHEVAQRTEELHRSHAELMRKEQRLQVLLAAAPVGVLELDEADCCSYLNANGAVLSACAPEQAQGLPLMDFVHPLERERVQQAWGSMRSFDTVQSVEFRLNRSDLWCAAYWIQCRQPDEAAAHTIMVLVDSTLQHQQAQQLWAMAHTDLLTGLPNRNLFLDRCTHALTLARRLDMGAALLWIDLDGFKAVNDKLGHAAGDVLLQLVAQRLKDRIRDSDTVARIGGDEFAVILSDVTHPSVAVQLANELVVALRHPYAMAQGVAQISASIGIALYPLHADAVDTLLRRADIAMYGAKHAGKNQVLVWSESCPVDMEGPSQFSTL
jgi:diguanylate cyclase (GGDEF)-like protein